MSNEEPSVKKLVNDAAAKREEARLEWEKWNNFIQCIEEITGIGPDDDEEEEEETEGDTDEEGEEEEEEARIPLSDDPPGASISPYITGMKLPGVQTATEIAVTASTKQADSPVTITPKETAPLTESGNRPWMMWEKELLEERRAQTPPVSYEDIGTELKRTTASCQVKFSQLKVARERAARQVGAS